MPLLFLYVNLFIRIAFAACMPFLFKIVCIVEKKTEDNHRESREWRLGMHGSGDSMEMADSVGAHPAGPFGCVLSLALSSSFGSRGGRIGFWACYRTLLFAWLWFYLLVSCMDVLGSSHARKFFIINKITRVLLKLFNFSRANMINKQI